MSKRLPVVVAVLVLAWALPAAAQIEIRMMTYGDQFEAYRAIEEAFNASHPGYKLVIEASPYAEYISKVQVNILAGTPPDVFQAWAQYKPTWVEQGILLELDDYWAKSEIAQNAELYPFVLDAAMYNGKIYGVPHDFNPFIMFLNVDEFDRAGIPLPDENWTVDDMIRYAIRLNDPARGVWGVQLNGHWSINNWQWAVLYNGHGWLSDDRTRVLVDEPEMIDMLEMWYDLVFTRQVANPAGWDPSATQQYAGAYAIWQGWTGWSFRVASDATYNWALATFPKGPANNYSFAQGHLWAVPANVPDPDKSWMVLEWLLSPEGQAVIVEAEHRQPLSPDPDLWATYFGQLPADKRQEVQDFIMGVVYGKNLIHNMQYFPDFDRADQIMNANLNTIFYENQSPATAMQTAAEQLRALLGL